MCGAAALCISQTFLLGKPVVAIREDLVIVSISTRSVDSEGSFVSDR